MLFYYLWMWMSVPDCPAGMVEVPGTMACIDQYEWPNVKGKNPWVGISGLPIVNDEESKVMNAEALCESVGKRVCQKSEWVRSCRGEGGSTYPWGWEVPKKVTEETAPCNYAKAIRPFFDDKIAERNLWEFTRLWQGEPSGERETCVSASGAQDMIGNVEEWVRCSESPYGWCLMGRFWAGGPPYRCDRYITTHDPRWFYYESGTRCCLDREVR